MAGGLDAFLTFGQGWANSKSIEIDGETTDSFEKGFGSSQLTQYSMGFSLDTAAGTETDNNSGDTATHSPELKPIQVTKMVDSASPMIMQAMTIGTRFEDVWIWQKKSGASKTKSGDYFWMIHLENVNISDCTWSADDGSLTETLTLTYQKIDVEYKKQLPTGELDKKSQRGRYPEPGAKLSVVKSKPNGDTAQIEQKILATLKKLNPSLKIS
jgi:type VI secretion system Hcp family effector